MAVSEGMKFGTVKSEKASADSGSNRFGTHSSKQAKTPEEEKQDEIAYGHNPPHDKPRRALSHVSSGKRSPAWQTESQMRSSQERLRQDSGIMRNVKYSVEEDHITKSSETERSAECNAV